MVIEEAIEILSDSANRGMTTFNDKFREAERLGIEALKRELKYRRDHPDVSAFLLPGETVE